MEVKAQIAAAWGKFHALWPVLGKRDGDLRNRLRLFDARVSQFVVLRVVANHQEGERLVEEHPKQHATQNCWAKTGAR